ncbi:membrane lipoprotein lipid attachment site-containing protein [Flavivirga jejuensis]|uniref:Type IV secretion system putative lipoprotein virB7 n=1 Tax=Flavivirga jejuensis TaxID=870487 RepID=A0ABT8WHX6_9FLAO|nr:membrane lipoprotein lipid attachment site-containing protein [Flavivirga jejuensis]MDO5972697.1 membrane lipoprotein lipid attachment site-containing protein [Flavivirga jejuensis]
MKKIISLLVLTLILTACSSSDETNNPDNPSTGTTKFIKQMVSKKYQQEHGGYFPDQFVYNNDRLVKALIYGCSGMLYQFKYGTNNKIETYYRKSGFNPEDLLIDIPKEDFNVVGSIKYDNQDRVIEQEESNVSMGVRTVLKINIEYDQNNRISKLLVIEYEGGPTISLIVEEFDENNNPIKTNIGSYNYDDKANPLYPLFQKFGLFHIETCNSLDVKGLFMSLNNVKEAYNEDSTQIFSAIYEYDQDEYPTKATYTTKYSSDVDIFSYN